MSADVRVRGLRQVAQRVEDLDRAVRWYAALLGREPIAAFDPPGLAFFDVGGVRLLLDRGAPPGLLYLDVPDVEGAVADLRASGAVIDTAPHVIFSDATGAFGPPGKDEVLAFVRDSGGNLLGSSVGVHAAEPNRCPRPTLVHCAARRRCPMAIPFLSDAWLAEVERRLNASEAFRAKAAGADATIQQVVPTAAGDERYWIRIAGGAVTVGRGDATSPDVTITQDLPTAIALAKRELNPVTAFMTGRLKVTGNMGLLMKLQAAVSELPAAMEGVEVDYP